MEENFHNNLTKFPKYGKYNLFYNYSNGVEKILQNYVKMSEHFLKN